MKKKSSPRSRRRTPRSAVDAPVSPVSVARAKKKAARKSAQTGHEFVAFLRLPPKSMQIDIDSPPKHLVIDGVDPDGGPGAVERGLSALFARRRYEASGDSIDVLNAFSLAVQAGLVPQPEILEWLADAFRKYIEGGEKLGDLERLLGLAGGAGPSAPIKRWVEQQALRQAMQGMVWLVKLGATIPDAAHMVAEKWRDDISGKKGATRPLTSKTLESKYRRGEAGKDAKLEALSDWRPTREDIDAFLSRFPDTTVRVTRTKRQLRRPG